MSEPDKTKETNLGDLIAQLKGVDPVEFSKAIEKEAPDHYNASWKMGYGAAKGEFQPKINASTESLEKLQKEVEAREAKIKELTEKTPDLAKLEAKYELTLQEKAAELEKAQKDFAAQLQEKDGVVLLERQESYNASLARKLVELGADADYAEVLIAKPSTQGRIKWGNEKMPKVYQEDGQTPFPQAGNKPSYEVLAQDLFKGIPDKFINDRKPSDPGFGSRPGDVSNFANLGDDQKDAFLSKIWSGRL